MMAPGRELTHPSTPDRAHKLRIRAVMICKDAEFHAYLKDVWGVMEADEAKAARMTREFCGVKSRAEIMPGTPAADAFRTLCADYENWLNNRND